jgi:hypothetical protein
MGAWGAGIFAEDTACDVRDAYRRAIADGLDAPAARETVLKQFASALGDAEDGPIVWLALAATAWNMGRLDDDTRDRALQIIARREALARWEEAGLGPKRLAELARLADRLRLPQKPPTKSRAKRGFVSAWELGEIVGYRQTGGMWLALHVIGHTEGEAGAFPVVNLLDWTAATVPTEADLAAAAVILFPPEWDLSLPKRADLCLLLTRKMERAETFARWSLHRKPVRSGPFRDEDLSYVGPALFERDIVGLWRSAK